MSGEPFGVCCLHMVIILVFKFVSRCLSECAGAELQSAEAGSS